MKTISSSAQKPVNQASVSLQADIIRAWRKAWEFVAFEGSWPICLATEPTEASARKRGKRIPNLGDLEAGLRETAYPPRGPGIGEWRQYTSQARAARELLASLPGLNARARRYSVWSQ